MTETARVFVAVTSECGGEAAEILRPLRGLPLGVKIGLELFCREGPDLVKAVHDQGFQVFLDLKFHDIPHTVAGAVESACLLRPRILNVHASGGREMMKAGLEALSPGTMLIGVTVLTSLDSSDLALLAPGLTPERAATRLAEAAKSAGLHGVVCSPREAGAVRAATGKDFFIITPGIRPGDSSRDDQKRVATPGEAILSGADSLVVGRPVTGARDRREAAISILREVDEALQG